jgi:two-component system, NtrC family, response regulator AtoC
MATVSHVQNLGTSLGFVAGQSPAIQNLNAMIGQIAGTNIPVMLLGESGTGKEVYARLIHRLSLHRHMPFTKLSCRATEPGNLFAQLKARLSIEGEEISEGTRTIFLDGIDDLDLACQTALLSLMPDGEQLEKGDAQVRLITSASRDLDKEIERGRFRKELFFRINGVCLRLPPLRKRDSDIPLFLEYFLAKYASQSDRAIPSLSEEELQLLGTHEWPGNIRELENFARKITLFGQTQSAIEELRSIPEIPSRLLAEVPYSSLKAAARTASRQAEKELIRNALERTHWNRKKAAQQLNISYKSLLYKIKQTGLIGQG